MFNDWLLFARPRAKMSDERLLSLTRRRHCFTIFIGHFSIFRIDFNIPRFYDISSCHNIYAFLD